MTFYIRKTVDGRAVWLKRMSPAIVWGPKAQAMTFAGKGNARLALQVIPKGEQAEIATEESGNGA